MSSMKTSSMKTSSTTTSSRKTFTPAQFALLEDLLCADATLLADSHEGGGESGGAGGGQGCDDDGEETSPCSLPGVNGTNQDDTMIGAGGSQHYLGLSGHDTLSGGGGRDCLEGGNGNDILDGGPGRDFLHGDNGDDELRGGMGRDDLFGGNGNDLLIGGCGPDLMDGGRGDDVLFGGNAPDTYTGGLGSDVFVLALAGNGGGHDQMSEIVDPLAPMAHEDEEGDVITDFRQGVDHLALASGITFSQLDFRSEKIYVVENGHGSSVSLSPGEESHHDEGRLLATLIGFDTSRLTTSDFLTCADLAAV